jgi:glycyl-tRNA synthetase beta chain
MKEAISASYKFYAGRLPVPDSAVSDQLLQFLGQRVETLLGESGERRDLVAAVVAVGIDDPALLTKRLSAVKEFEKDERFSTLVTAFKRAYNITKDEQEAEVDVDLFEEDAEKDLHNACRRILKEFNSHVYEQDFARALALLLELSTPIDVFFDQVMVMHEDANLRRNRLSLLGWITSLFLGIADFSKMEVG